jgi:hypothetical protein
VQPSIIGARVPRRVRTSRPPAWRVSTVFAATHVKRKVKPSGSRAPRQQKGVALPHCGLLRHLHRSDLGQSPTAAQQRTRQGPALRGVQATQKVSPRLGLARWHRRIPRRSRTFKRGFQTKRAWRSSGFGPRGRRKCSCPAPRSKTTSLTGPSDHLASSQAMMLRPAGVL